MNNTQIQLCKVKFYPGGNEHLNHMVDRLSPSVTHISITETCEYVTLHRTPVTIHEWF
jgi:hypothetical protein